MSQFLSSIGASLEPPDYVTPPFPSLFWPIPWHGYQWNYLYHAGDIWKYTLYWTMIFYAALHLGASGFAVAVQWHNWRYIWIAPVIFVVIGITEAIIAGSIVGGLLGAIYNAGYFQMTTWVPFTWGLVNAMIVLVSSFAISGAL